MKKQHSERGDALISMLVSLGLMAVVLMGATTYIFNSTRDSHDLETRTDNLDNARKVFNLVSRELRMIGTSLPLGQSGFDPQDTGLGDSSLSLLTSSNAGSIVFRMNEKGASTFLNADYTPDPSSLSFSVFDADDIYSGEDIYISDMPLGGTSGLWGTVTGVSGNTVSISGLYQTQAGASFGTGSIVTRSTEVEYANDSGNIVRIDGAGSLIIAPRATISFAYLDSTGTALSLPLTRAEIDNTLSALQVTITSQASSAQKNGTTHATTLTRVISLRGLILSRF